MLQIFEIYLYVCAAIISIATIIGLVALLANLVVYAYQTYIGFNTFRKFLRKYHNEMKKERVIKANVDIAFNKTKKED